VPISHASHGEKYNLHGVEVCRSYCILSREIRSLEKIESRQFSRQLKEFCSEQAVFDRLFALEKSKKNATT